MAQHPAAHRFACVRAVPRRPFEGGATLVDKIIADMRPAGIGRVLNPVG
jgi:hypothetical protein